MYLLLDNSDEKEIHFYLSLNNKVVQYDLPFEYKSLPELMSVVLSRAGVGLGDIRGVAVVVGRGKFTATRLAVTFVNTLAFALQIPVVIADQSDEWVSKIVAQPVGVYVSAQYSGEARIGGV